MNDKEQIYEESFKYGINVLFAEKPLDKTICKVVEELNELATKLMQYVNKPGSVSYGEIEEEIVDVKMNCRLLELHFPVSSEIENRKIDKFINSKDFNIYKEIYESRQESKPNR